MVSGSPGPIVWPVNGIPLYNPNTGGNWIVQLVDPVFPLGLCPDGFMPGVNILYSYPANDTVGIDNQGPGPHDWMYAGGAWLHPSFGHLVIRALIDSAWYGTDTVTLGQIRILYQ
jgi:hypothetical protein